MRAASSRRAPKGAAPQALLLFGACSPGTEPGRVALIPYKPVVVDLSRLDALAPPWLRVSESKAVRGGQSAASGHARLFVDFVGHLAARATAESKLADLGSVFVERLPAGEARERVGVVAAFRPDAPAEDFEKAGLDIKSAGDAWCVAFRDEFVGALSGPRKARSWRVWSEAPEGLTSAALRKAMEFQERGEDAHLLGSWGPALEAERERAELAAIKPGRRSKERGGPASKPESSRSRRI